jgi:MFS family permease
LKDDNLLETNVKTAGSNLNKLPNLFWHLTMLIIFIYGAVVPFNYIASGFIIEISLKDMPNEQAQIIAGLYLCIPFLLSSLLIPIYGYIVDRYGKRTYSLVFSTLSGLLSFTGFFYLPPIYPLIFLGFTYSLCAATLWPCVSIVVNSELVVLFQYLFFRI